MVGVFFMVEIWVYIRCFGCCRWRFRSYSESPFPDAEKVTQKAWPRRSALAVARVPSLRDSSGGIASGLLRCTSSRCVWLRQTSLRSFPRINPSTQPADGAGTARSRAAAELTLILCRSCRRLGPRSDDLLILWELACQQWRPARRPISACPPQSLWERACSRRRSIGQPIRDRQTHHLTPVNP